MAADVKRQVVLDTETTGLEWKKGNRVVEIGCVELVERRPTGRTFHCYLNPDREFEPGAQQVTGLTLEFLQDKPRFAAVVDEFLAFVEGAELVIHNAAFDLGFLDAELARLDGYPGMSGRCTVEDSLLLARQRFPGQRNSLDALCKRLGVDNSQRALHGALLDAQIIPTRMTFVDIAGLVRGASKGEGLGNQFLANIRECDAIAHVLRCFEDGDITHVEGRIDPVADAETIETELMLADLEPANAPLRR